MSAKQHTSKDLNNVNFIQSSTSQQWSTLLAYGVLAPSVHNQQPWRLKIDTAKLILNLEPRRLLEHGDPTHRQAWISLGAFAKTIQLAAQAYGGSVVSNFDESANQVILTLQIARSITHLDTDTLQAIKERRSNRSFYKPTIIEKSTLAFLRDDITVPAVQTFISTDSALRQYTAELLFQAISMALTIPQFRNELSSVIVSNSPKNTTGIPIHALGYKNFVSAQAGLLRNKKFLKAQDEATKDYKRVMSASAVAFITSKGDTPPYWFRAGQAYQHLLIQATKAGLATSTFAGLVEAPDFHKDIEQKLQTKQRLQAVVRLGQAKTTVKTTPRITVDDLLH